MESSKMTSFKYLKKNCLLIMTLFSVIFGILLGGLLRFTNPSTELIRCIGFPGELFMNTLKCLILPLISASLISGLSQLDVKTSGKMGSTAVMYYALTTTHAVILGIIVVLLVHPGHPSIKNDNSASEITGREASTADTFMDLGRNLFSDNIIRSTIQQQQSYYVTVFDNTTGSIQRIHKLHYVEGMNVLGLILFCIAIGIVIAKVGPPAKPLADLFSALDVVICRLVTYVMWLGPIGIPSLIAQKMLEVEDLLNTAQMLGMFILTVCLGLTMQCFGTLPLIMLTFSRTNPYKFLAGLGPAILTALGTSSSGATLPITFQCLNKIGVDPRVTKFVLPVGSMVNMDGTALYEAVASIFIAQMNGLQMTLDQIVTVSITATLAAVGAAAIPSAGLVTMLIVLTALGLPTSELSLIIAVDWFLDRLRTSVNVIGDAFGCRVVEHLCRNDLMESKLSQENEFNCSTKERLSLSPRKESHPV